MPPSGFWATLVQNLELVCEPGRRGRRDDVGDDFFSEVTGRIPFGGLDSADPLAFKVYEPDRIVLGKRMEDHLRIGVCLWHSFAWRSEEHTSELQSLRHLVCRLLL